MRSFGDALKKETNGPETVVAALWVDASLSESLRHAAIRAVLRRQTP
jgi:hypothetical protein